MKTKFKSFCLTALLLLFGQSLFAHDFEADGIYYTYLSKTDKTVSVSYQGSSYNEYSNEYTGDVVIPASVTYNGTTYSVTSIGEYAFRGCTGLTSIGYRMFYGCTGLTNIEIPNSVTSIDYCTFAKCTGLTSATIGNGVTSISSNVFEGCTGLTSVTIEATHIGGYMFEGCTGLTNVTIGNSVKGISEAILLSKVARD